VRRHAALDHVFLPRRPGLIIDGKSALHAEVSRMIGPNGRVFVLEFGVAEGTTMTTSYGGLPIQLVP
jgi:hypothetical protein